MEKCLPRENLPSPWDFDGEWSMPCPPQASLAALLWGLRPLRPPSALSAQLYPGANKVASYPSCAGVTSHLPEWSKVNVW